LGLSEFFTLSLRLASNKQAQSSKRGRVALLSGATLDFEESKFDEIFPSTLIERK